MGRVLKEKVNFNNDEILKDNCINFDIEKTVDLSNIFYGLNNAFNVDISLKKSDERIQDFNKLANIAKRNNDKFNDKGIFCSYIATNFVQIDIQLEEEIKQFTIPTTFYCARVNSVSEKDIVINLEQRPIVNEKLITLINYLYPDQEPIDVKIFENVENIHETLLQMIPILRDLNYYPLCFGSFLPHEDKLKKEVKQIANENIDLYESKTKKPKQDYENLEFEEEPLLVINNQLNFYQKIAIRCALNENTIIYGPPGTGKSEIIVNLIANSIVNEKKLLVVCEKKAALDVLTERLKRIEGLCLFLNAIHNENQVYDKINEIQESLGNFWELENNEVHEVNLKQEINKLLSIQKYNKKWHEFYEQVNEWIKIDDMPKSILDYDSYEREIKELNEIKERILNFNLLEEYANINLKPNQSVWYLIRRIFYFNEFKNKFLLNDDEIDQYFELLEKFNKEQATSLFIDQLDFNKDFEQRYLEFYKIMKMINIEKDTKFFDALKKDTHIFEQQINVLRKINQKCNKIIQEKSFWKFLVNHRKYHQTFLNSLNKMPEYYRLNALNHYLTTGKIKKWSYKLKKFSEQECEILRQKYQAISLFSTLVLPNNCNYLLSSDFDIEKVWKNLTCDLVYFYLNPQMKNEPMKYLIKHQAIKADKELIDIIEKSVLNTCVSKINNVVQFEELNTSKKLLGEKSINQKIIDFIKENEQTIETISDDIYVKYIEWLRNILIKKDDDFKKQAKEMFQVSKIPKQRMKITNFIRRYEKILRSIFPIWIGSPNDISNFVEFEKELFDMAIIDEASQMLMENALPTLYRSKHYVIAGDDKQLKATVTFSKKYKNNEILDYVEEIDFDIVESLLDRANVSLWNSFILRNHYRSKKQELISFSNEYIYDNQLIFASMNNLDFAAVDVITLDNGLYINGVNQQEAYEVVNQLEKNVDTYKTFLVITFSASQAEYIEKLLLKSPMVNRFNQMIFDNKLKIRNLENVQGFEADCVILSLSYGPKKEGERNIKIMGPIIQDGGFNRLNVAITRAKEKMINIKSFNSNFNVNRDNKNAYIFHQYISYLDNLQETYDSLIHVHQELTPKYKYGIQILEWIIPFLEANNLNYTCNHKLGNFLADIVIYDQNLNHIKLVICLDYWSKYNQTKELINSINAQEYLMNINYQFIRIKELEWQFAKEMIKQEIMKLMEWSGNV